jgi:uncharacterized MAPEG superfamily protein
MLIGDYPVEMLVLAWGCILALVHIFAAINVKTKQYGTEWNMSARDGDMPKLNPVAARLDRAQANYFETFPIVIACTLALVLMARTSDLTGVGALVWLGARIVYLPLYWTGVPKVRTLVFLVSMIGILMMLFPLLLP